MIHQTFYNLNKEKRERIIQSAYKEFLACPYEKSSINRIIEGAHIPKGSFYQYFDDKEDLFYLCIANVYMKMLSERQNHQESLIETGFLRTQDIGYEAGASMFTEELYRYLSKDDLALLDMMLLAPDTIRNAIQTRLSADMIAPVLKDELKASPRIRDDIDYDFFAYLIAMGEQLSIDFGNRRHLDSKAMMHYNYLFQTMIYKMISKD